MNWRGLVALVFAVAFSTAHGQTFRQYLKLRAQYHITAAASVSALDTLIGSRVLEVSGTVKGSFTVKDATVLLLERGDGNSDVIRASGVPEWLTGNEMKVRMIVQASRKESGDELEATLVGAAPEVDVSQVEAEVRAAHDAAIARKAKASAMAPPKGVAARRQWNVPVNEATPVYAAWIKRHNPKLRNDQAMEIAGALIGYSQKYGVDARLIVAIVVAESDFNPAETSNKGAMGLGQLMPGTARDFGISNAYDTTANLYGTVREISNDLHRYGSERDELQHLALALAAYNAGIGAVARAGGVPPFRETRAYIRKVISLYYRLCDPRS